MHILRLLLALPLLTCLLPACGGATSAPYLGTWVLDPDAEQSGESTNSTDPSADLGNIAPPETSLELVLTIHEDGRFELNGAGSPVKISSSGTWEFAEGRLQLSGGMTGVARLQNGLLTIGSESIDAPTIVYRRGD